MGHFGPADLLVIDRRCGAQDALGKDYNSITEGVVLVWTIVGWEYALDWLAWRFPALRPLLKAPALKLIENGRVLEQNMRKEMLTRDELMGQLREEGVEDLAAVKVARLEGDGRLSVIKCKNSRRARSASVSTMSGREAHVLGCRRNRQCRCVSLAKPPGSACMGPGVRP